jgi:predicted lysophospholipase L1 biosynthesis ABC-type transport system permease subunit
MKRKLALSLIAMAFALAAAAPAAAQSLQQAARQAAKQHNAKVLSAHTVKRRNQPVHVIKLLTKKGVVKTVRIPDQRGQNKPR